MSFNIKKIEKKLDIKINNESLFTEAFTHKSKDQKINNEKLEFLGDRVIALVLSKKLFDLYPNENEGILDKRFAKLVNRKTCATISWSIGLNNFVVFGDKSKKLNINDEKILSDLCEAVIGAIYIDSGFDYAEKFILNKWNKNIKSSNKTILDSKTELQEYSLKKYKKLPAYNVLNSSGPRHKPLFKISVKIPNSKICFGYGNSKQEAQQKAAGNLLKDLKKN